MHTTLRAFGNSQGVIIPRPILAQVGFVDAVEMTIEAGALVLRPARPTSRSGWAAASQALAASGDDALIWPDFAHSEDVVLQW